MKHIKRAVCSQEKTDQVNGAGGAEGGRSYKQCGFQ